jgi:hypothetical protein
MDREKGWTDRHLDRLTVMHIDSKIDKKIGGGQTDEQMERQR